VRLLVLSTLKEGSALSLPISYISDQSLVTPPAHVLPQLAHVLPQLAHVLPQSPPSPTQLQLLQLNVGPSLSSLSSFWAERTGSHQKSCVVLSCSEVSLRWFSVVFVFTLIPFIEIRVNR